MRILHDGTDYVNERCMFTNQILTCERRLALLGKNNFEI